LCPYSQVGLYRLYTASIGQLKPHRPIGTWILCQNFSLQRMLPVPAWVFWDRPPVVERSIPAASFASYQRLLSSTAVETRRLSASYLRRETKIALTRCSAIVVKHARMSVGWSAIISPPPAVILQQLPSQSPGDSMAASLVNSCGFRSHRQVARENFNHVGIIRTGTCRHAFAWVNQFPATSVCPTRSSLPTPK